MTLNLLSFSLSLSMTFIAYETTTMNFKSQRRCITHTHKPHHRIDNDILYIYSIVEAGKAKQALGECPWPCPNNSNSKRIPYFPLVLVYAPRHTIQQQQQQLRWRQHQHHRVDNAINSDCMRHTIFRYMEMAICAIIAPYGRCAAFYFM